MTPTFGLTQCFTIRTDAISADAIDGEVIIVNLKNGVYYSLTALGAEIWGQLRDCVSPGQIVDRLLARYAEDRTKICEWVLRFMTELEAEALIVRAPAGQAAAPRTAQELPRGVSAMGIVQAPVLMKYTDLRQIVLLSAAAYDRLTDSE
jgi:hypothetical protein